MEWPPRTDGEHDPRDERKLGDFQKQSQDDALDPRVIELATTLARPRKPDDWIGIAREVHRFVRDGVRYQHDPGRVQLRTPAPETLQKGWGNCQAKTILVVALLKALGFVAEVFPYWEGPILTHVIYRVRFPGSARAPEAMPDGWLYGEQTIRGSELGQNPLTLGTNPDTGALPLSGSETI